MADNVDVLADIGQNRLEQVYINMPQVRFYFSGDREQTAENLTAYLGKEQLELDSFSAFDQTDGSLYYYVLLDVSASITKKEFTGITQGLEAFCRNVREQDHVLFLTFGEEVKTVFDMDGKALQEGDAGEVIRQLSNPDQRTLLFEAIHQMSELAENVTAQESTRRVAFVITDGEDIATGKATREEALATLQESGIPVYGFVAGSSGRQNLNAFGEFSRATGGYLTVLTQGEEESGFEQVREELLHSYEAVFVADSNLVSNTSVSAVLQFSETGEKSTLQVMQDRWIPDTQAPEIQEVILENNKQLRVIFTEAVEGSEAADNFRLESEENSLLPAYASPGSDKTSVVLSFAEEIPGGSYELVCQNLTDVSMEENLLEDTAALEVETVTEVEEVVAAEPEQSNFFKDYGWILVLVLLAVLGTAFGIAWKKLKKRQAVVTVEGKAVLTDNVSVSHKVSLEKKQLEEKQVYFHVAGQKGEIPITIRKSMIVGRSNTCELIFDDPALSRQHFALELKEGGVLIQNLSQSGYTEVNGIRLGASQRPLKPGDEIRAGQLKLTIRW